MRPGLFIGILPLIRIRIDFIASIEAIDQHIVGPVAEKLKNFPEWRLLYLPDHYTRVDNRKHDAAPPPFMMSGSKVAKLRDQPLTEANANASGIHIAVGHGRVRCRYRCATRPGSRPLDHRHRATRLCANVKLGYGKNRHQYPNVEPSRTRNRPKTGQNKPQTARPPKACEAKMRHLASQNNQQPIWRFKNAVGSAAVLGRHHACAWMCC